MEFGQFCCGEPQNFVNWPAEFGKIFREKLWALLMTMSLIIDPPLSSNKQHYDIDDCLGDNREDY